MRVMAGTKLSLPLALGASLLFGGPATAAEPAVNIEFERYKLANGLEVILHQDRSAPQIAVNVWYHVGSGNEVPGRSGFAHLFEHMMFQGAKHIGEDVHFDILREIGGSGINGTTNPDRTNYFEVVPSHHLETALWLESDRMGYLLDLLNQKSLENQQEVVRNERRQRYDNVPYGRERFAVAEALYPEGHPYRYLTIGRHEDLEAAKLEDVRAFFTTWYVPSNATLTIAGDVDPAVARKLVDKWFGTFPALPRPETKVVTAPPLESTSRKELDDPFARLRRVHYVWRSPAQLADGDLELDVAAEVLGAGGWGRLHKKLIIDLEVAQNVTVYQYGSGFSGEFHVIADLKPKADMAEIESILRAEVERLTREPITDAELRRCLLGTESGFIWGLEELMGRVERLQYFNHYTGDPGYTGKYLERLRAVTPAKVQATAAQWLTKGHAEIITVPAAKAGSAQAGAQGGKQG